MSTEQQLKQAIARARKALDAEREGVLPDDVDPDDAAREAYWRGWLRQALTTLIEDLTSEEGGE